MKIRLVATCAAIVLAVVVAPASSAAVKEGGACKKAGQVSEAAGMKYKCVKKGNKLIWGKGVAVKEAPSATPVASATPSAEAAGYTMAKVKANNSTASCWSVISGNVYDLTKWINSHPGGSGAIASLCGRDGTADFLGMHGGQGKPQSRLAGYLLGPLAK